MTSVSDSSSAGEQGSPGLDTADMLDENPSASPQ